MLDNAVCWFEIYVNDMARAKSFYERVFDVTLDSLAGPDLEMWAFPANMEKSGTGGALVHQPDVPAGGNSTLVYFACADCAIEEARVPGAGGRVHRAKMSIGQYGFITLAYDTEGNLFGLHSLK